MKFSSTVKYIIIICFISSCVTKKQKIVNINESIQRTSFDYGFKMDGYWVWCGSPIKGEDGRYHLFASRWPKKYMMHPGWVFYSEIVRASSKNPEGPYKFEEVVFKKRDSKYFDAKMTHNPAIRKYGDKYILFYTGTNYPDSILTDKYGNRAAEYDSKNPNIGYDIAWNNKRIGIAWSNSVYGPWHRRDKPILETRPDKWDNSITSNPAPWIMPNGTIYLLYKSSDRKVNKDAPFMLGAAKADNYLSEFKRIADNPVISFKDNSHVEDPFLWYDGVRFNAIMKDMTGSIGGEEGAGIHMISKDCISWELAKCPKAYSRTLTFENGEQKKMGSFERPQLLIENNVPKYLFAATSDGEGGFVRAANTWNICIPLKTKVARCK